MLPITFLELGEQRELAVLLTVMNLIDMIPRRRQDGETFQVQKEKITAFLFLL